MRAWWIALGVLVATCPTSGSAQALVDPKPNNPPPFPYEVTSAEEEALAATYCGQSDVSGCVTYQRQRRGQLQDLWSNRYTQPVDRQAMINAIKANSSPAGVRWDLALSQYRTELSERAVADGRAHRFNGNGYPSSSFTVHCSSSWGRGWSTSTCTGN